MQAEDPSGCRRISTDGLDAFADALFDALNEAFCNDGDDPATAGSKAEALADGLFNLNNIDAYAKLSKGPGKKVARPN